MYRTICVLVVVLAATLAAHAAVEMLGDFETDASLAEWVCDTPGGRVEATTEGALVGTRVGVFVYPPSDQPSWPMIARHFDQPRDWSGYEFLGYHLANISDAGVWFWLQVASADGRYAQLGFNVAAGEGMWCIYLLGEIAGEVDLAHVTELRFMLARPKQEMRMALDGIFVGDETTSVTGMQPMIRLAPERADQQGLEGAFRETLLSLYGPGLVDVDTGLPHEFFSITERRPMQDDHWVHQSIGGDDTTEQHTPYMLYAAATGDPAIIAIERRLLDAMTTTLDPGDGLVGCYRWKWRERQLSPFWGWIRSPVTREYYQLSDAEHGAECALYSLTPGAWLLHHPGALRSLESYSRTLLAINSRPGFVHFALFIGREPDGRYVAYDWDGKTLNQATLSDDPAQACGDIMEFWWIMPMLACAGITDDADLRAQIIGRIEPVMDNVARFQQADGNVATTYRMDGGSGERTTPGYMYERGSVLDNWTKACYAMHALTGDEKYLRQVRRYWKCPDARRDLSLMIFDKLHNGTDELDAVIEEEIAALKPEVMAGEPGGANRDERWAVSMALATVYTGDPKYLNSALEWEKSWRRMQYREVGGYYYYFSRATNTYVSRYAYDFVQAEGITGHFIADHFRGPISDLIVIKHLGDQTQGLVGRNLLELGWML
ncbi:MAG TPA: hypothetical protein VM283_05300 [Armatimonadota bacterium]|nr:hypothetical protein [Armatimonadota bacterium]